MNVTTSPRYKQTLYAPPRRELLVTEQEKQKALSDFNQFQGFQDLVPTIPDRILTILATDLNKNKTLKQTKSKHVSTLNEEFQRDTSIGIRLEQAIAYLTQDNKKLKSFRDIKRNKVHY
jgi:hypothetical protein